MTTVACVLRSGGPDFDVRWVRALRRGVAENLWGHRFECLTDVPVVYGVIQCPMEYAWPGWWSKLELFRPGLFPRGRLVVYFDLDTLIVGDISWLADYAGDFAMIRGFYTDVRQSGVMAWRPGPLTDSIWEAWTADPESHMANYRGDGRWLHDHLPDDGVDQLLDLYPGRIVSFKLDARRGPPEGASVICGHGAPRFSDHNAGWAWDRWTRLSI